ncbi:MAG: hypothetical protein COU22_00040 [Candidatus Komeilibacteria bacterium CG10_big_fil_rev_8_21_14_0_10_41_13]|uniref:Uncharacterized protein n=1 Tax=Candidatus Komeilibacteria bacterium CG10_big_fil_rev_8_21_14_0_10_41_13 TaxID=1974476 RepID=A0A2M6WDK5_9BACT|nr:MAG: hypothetical protein COU22_00040 [Candidatus Komeilibacteria bacterium CG10_big_fil_rev_8_21_14_0_10_41_13]
MSFEASGHIVEEELIGSQSVLSEIEKRHAIEYEKYDICLERVERVQDIKKLPFDPENPDAQRYPFAAGLHKSVVEELALQIEDFKASQLRLYTAVGSILDVKHGVDGFLKLNHAGKQITVTFDVTMNTAKRDYKSDVIIEIPDEGFDTSPAEDGNGIVDQELLDDVLHRYRRAIALLFKSKIKSFNRRQFSRRQNTNKQQGTGTYG